MGQLAGRLRELVRLYGSDERAWQPQIDAVADLERSDTARAHAQFTALRDELRDRRHRDLLAGVRKLAWVHALPVDVEEPATDKEKDRAIRLLETALDHARTVMEAVAEARRLAAEVESRRVEAGADAFARVAFPDLPRAAADAEALRRRVAREARVDARARALKQRAGKLDPVRVTAPDVSSEAVPDAGDAHAILDDAEARVKDAERVNAAHARVRRALRDPAVRARRRRDARRVKDAAADAVKRAHAAAEDAAARLEALAGEAESLRRDAAAEATRAARARKRGLAPPDRDRGDPPDYIH